MSDCFYAQRACAFDRGEAYLELGLGRGSLRLRAGNGVGLAMVGDWLGARGLTPAGWEGRWVGEWMELGLGRGSLRLRAGNSVGLANGWRLAWFGEGLRLRAGNGTEWVENGGYGPCAGDF